MGSKVIGFRMPDDLADELERVSGERGMTTADFLRKLVDDVLYPSNRERSSTMPDAATKEQLNNLEETQASLVDELRALSNQVDKLGEELQLARVTKAMLEATQDEVAKATALAAKVDDWRNSHNKLARVVNDNVEVVKRLPGVIEGQTDRLYQILLTYIEVGTLSPEALELLRERAKAADSRRGELPVVGIVKGKVTAPGYRYLPNIDMSIRKES